MVWSWVTSILKSVQPWLDILTLGVHDLVRADGYGTSQWTLQIFRTFNWYAAFVIQESLMLKYCLLINTWGHCNCMKNKSQLLVNTQISSAKKYRLQDTPDNTNIESWSDQTESVSLVGSNPSVVFIIINIIHLH